MSKPIKISIPKPCHENWKNMTPVEKGRFCASCQQKVYDFTNSSDREITSILRNEKNACGRLRIDQLDRDLVIPKEKNKFWVAATASIIAFFSLGSNEVLSQEIEVKIEQNKTDSENIIPPAKDTLTPSSIETIKISGLVKDKLGVIPGATVTNTTSKDTIETNIDGEFTINAKISDTIKTSFVGFTTHSFIAETKHEYEKQEVILESDIDIYQIGTIVYKRTFFGRIFHKIGSWFR
ncbi:hypothetical protein GCM10007424_21450 [Flavobacterium suaedae]|uniref:Carboxypeptidase-like regulatory domain-containing protein n=1 Tax=Flavobacterium suaedae TaxID=1767027 RepID=A0ABQ1JYS6_9FLAO|nr:carboxypeptidase-like regulatory domain-containing protein [Flavobacterium suaedae]GGB81059.1 hypothetical protein GCM10007424_21450 [Flavobacterium suaedae]